MQAVPSSIPTSGTFFHGDLVIKQNLRPFAFFRWFKTSSCQLLAKECALTTGKLPRSLAQEHVVRVTDHAQMCWRAVKQKSNQIKTAQSQKDSCFSLFEDFEKRIARHEKTIKDHNARAHAQWTIFHLFTLKLTETLSAIKLTETLSAIKLTETLSASSE